MQAPEKFSTIHGQDFHIRFDNSRPTVFALSAHKSGSTLFDHIIFDIAAKANIPSCNFEQQLFVQGISEHDITLPSLQLMEQKGVIFYGFRSLGKLRLFDNFNKSRKLILVRDPRDIVVSYYFSARLSHALPVEGVVRDQMEEHRQKYASTAIEEYILNGNADYPLYKMRDYIPLCSEPNTRVFRYEDVIFQKYEWTEALCKEFGADLSDAEIREIADRHDIRPDQERPDQHVRQVTPGNYQRYLSPTVINRLQNVFEDVFQYYGYPLETYA